MLRFFCDGSSRIVDGERCGFIGIVGYREGKLIAEQAAGVGTATSNEAEYHAVIGALVLAKRFGARRVQIVSDSQLVVRQLLGEYVVAEERLAKLVDAFEDLAEDFDEVAVEHGTHVQAHMLAWSGKAVERIESAMQKSGD
jgi:ribonuclease HI